MTKYLTSCFVSSTKDSFRDVSDIIQPMGVVREPVEIKTPEEEAIFHRLYRPLLNSSPRAESPRRRLHRLSSGVNFHYWPLDLVLVWPD